MIVKCITAVTCVFCYLYALFNLYNLTYFLSHHEKDEETITTSEKDESYDSALWSLIINMSLLSAFMLQHTLMANDFTKHLFCLLHMDYMERSIYNIASAMTLHLLISQWQIIPSIALWKFDTSTNDTLWYMFTVFHVLAWWTIYTGCLMMDISELAGIKQVYYKFSLLPSPMMTKSRELLRYYSHMRHPGFIGFLIILWIHPYMTLDRVLLASMLTVYMAFRWSIDKEDCAYHASLMRMKLRELF